jgi:hypothetical protein
MPQPLVSAHERQVSCDDTNDKFVDQKCSWHAPQKMTSDTKYHK